MDREIIANYISKIYLCDIDTARHLVSESDLVSDLTNISDIINDLEHRGVCNFAWRKNIGTLIQKLVRDRGWTDNQFYKILNANSYGYKLLPEIINHLYTSPRFRDWMVLYLGEFFEIAPDALLQELIIAI